MVGPIEPALNTGLGIDNRTAGQHERHGETREACGRQVEIGDLEDL